MTSQRLSFPGGARSNFIMISYSATHSNIKKVAQELLELFFQGFLLSFLLKDEESLPGPPRSCQESFS